MSCRTRYFGLLLLAATLAGAGCSPRVYLASDQARITTKRSPADEGAPFEVRTWSHFFLWGVAPIERRVIVDRIVSKQLGKQILYITDLRIRLGYTGSSMLAKIVSLGIYAPNVIEIKGKYHTSPDAVGYAETPVKLPPRKRAPPKRETPAAPTPPPAIVTSTDHFSLGMARARNADWDGAIAAFSAAIAKNPIDARPYYYRGVIRGNMGRMDDAVRDLNKAIELDARNHKALALRGNLSEAQGNLEAAAADYQAARKIAPKRYAGLLLSVNAALDERARRDTAKRNQVRLSIIVAKTRSQADQLRTALREGKTEFAVLARRHSAHHSLRDRGGDLGWINKGMFPPEIEALVFAAPPGEIVGPIKGRQGWLILHVTGRREPGRPERLWKASK